ncbi:MAG TPA: Uma2 family endonuclease [Roseiflexaceae bacterium]|nr:Uma2 family endonuclease [Roseiflexaceae bacterium]
MQRQPEIEDLDRLLRQGQIKLEITGGTRTWRLLPSVRHQKLIDRIRATIAPGDSMVGCVCHHLADVQLRFPDGSLKRPDIAIFCVEPPDIDEAWAQVPEAVIEIVSLGYEEKDLSINPPWYLAQGVKDVLVVDPRAGRLLHFGHGRPRLELPTPQPIALQCGCQVTIF